jgi:xanthine dehydrogenase accessory factor
MTSALRAASTHAATAAHRFGVLRNWPAAALRMLDAGPVVRVLLLELRGSGPREAGACMLIGAAGSSGTIGGGRLEWDALQAARALLAESAGPPARLLRLTLGRELGQCCGGVVRLWIERFAAADAPMLRNAAVGAGLAMRTEFDGSRSSRSLTLAGSERLRVAGAEGCISITENLADPHPPLWLFGAGHVGHAIARIAGDLPFRTTWVDARPDVFPREPPESIEVRSPAAPAAFALLAPPATRFIVMTHDHALDYALCKAILQRSDSAFLGVIGSRSKAARFRSRLLRDGVPADAVGAMVCPIGIGGIASKWPGAIAVAVAAQLLQGLDAPAQRCGAPADDGCDTLDCAQCGRRSTP